MKEHLYLKPQLSKYNSIQFFVDFKENAKQGKYISNDIKSVDFEDIITYDKLFILGEAGLGKSELLKQLVKQYPETNRIICDLKKCDGNVTKYITENFPKLNNNSNFLVCLDALDEVNENLINTTIRSIKNFIIDFPNVKLFITSRSHHLIRNGSSLETIKAEVLELQTLSPFQIVKYLKHYCDDINNDDIDLIFLLQNHNLYHYYSSNSILAVPRFLEIFVDLVKKDTFNKVVKYPRSKLIDEFIKGKLLAENNKDKGVNYRRKRYYILNVLEDLALTLEVQRTNQISKEDFHRFLYDNNHNLDAQMPFEDFWDNTILKDIGEILEFENTEFQEYLATKALSRLGRIDQTIFDIAIEQNLKDIYPNWKDIISFLIELEPTILLPIIQFSIRNERPHLFKLIQHIDYHFIENNPTLKEDVFNLIFDFHVRQQEVYRHDLEKGLAKYYTPKKHQERLKLSLHTKNVMVHYSDNFNLCLLLGELFKNENNFSTTEIEEWKDILFQFAYLPIKNNSQVIQRFAIKALQEIIIDIEEAEKLKEIYGKRGNHISDNIVNLYQKVNPNHSKSIELYFEDLGRDRINAIGHFDEINSKEGFINFFEKLIQITESKKRERYLYKFGDEKFGRRFYENLEKLWDTEIENLLLQLITNEQFHIYFSRKFITKKLLEIFLKKDENLVFRIIDRFYSFDELPDKYDYLTLITEILKIHQIPILIKLLDSYKSDLLLDIFLYSNDSEIRKIGKQYFPNELKKQEERIEKHKVKRGRSFYQIQLSFDEFIDKLNQNDFYSIWLFNQDKEQFQELISTSRKLKLRQLVIDLLENHIPFNEEIAQEKYHIGGLFFESINVIEYLDIDIQMYREKFIRLLFDEWNLDYDNKLGKVLDLLLPFSEDEEKFIIELITTKEEVTNEVFYQRIIEVFEKLTIVKSIRLLQKFIHNESIRNWERIKLIELLAKWDFDEKYFQELFQNYQSKEDTNNNFEILQTINRQFLINNDEKAIDWLVEQFKKYTYKRTKNPNSTSITSAAPTSRGYGLDRNLRVINHPKYRKKIIELLTFSIELLDSDYKYENYVSWHIWHPIDAYFQNLTQNKSLILENLKMLNDCINSFSNSDSARQFGYKIEYLQQIYLKELAEPIKLFDSIKTIKQLKEKQYLDISSPKDLFDLVFDIVNREFRYWIEKDGGNSLILDVNSKKRETFVQKVCVPLLQKILMEKGVRPSDISIHRENQTNNDKRIDVLISYGGIGCIMIELKREYSNDVTSKTYRENTFLHYMRSMNADYGVFLIIGDGEESISNSRKNPDNFKNKLQIANEIYENDWNIEVIGIDCLGK